MSRDLHWCKCTDCLWEHLFKMQTTAPSVPGVSYPWHGEGHAEVLSTLQPEAPRWWAAEGYRINVHSLDRKKKKVVLLSLETWKSWGYTVSWLSSAITTRHDTDRVEPGLVTCIDPLMVTLINWCQGPRTTLTHWYSDDAAVQWILLENTWIRSLRGAPDQTTDELFRYPNKPMRYWSYQPGHTLHDTPHQL